MQFVNVKQYYNALVAQRTEQIRPKDKIGVQFPSRAHSSFQIFYRAYIIFLALLELNWSHRQPDDKKFERLVR